MEMPTPAFPGYAHRIRCIRTSLNSQMRTRSFMYSEAGKELYSNSPQAFSRCIVYKVQSKSQRFHILHATRENSCILFKRLYELCRCVYNADAALCSMLYRVI